MHQVVRDLTDRQQALMRPRIRTEVRAPPAHQTESQPVGGVPPYPNSGLPARPSFPELAPRCQPRTRHGIPQVPVRDRGVEDSNPFQQSLGADPTAELVLKPAASMASFDRRSAALATLHRGLLTPGSLTRGRVTEPFSRTYERAAVHPVHRMPGDLCLSAESVLKPSASRSR